MPARDFTDEQFAAVLARIKRTAEEDQFRFSAWLDPPKPKRTSKPVIPGASEAAIRRRKRPKR
jgi:hypothetical protein